MKLPLSFFARFLLAASLLLAGVRSAPGAALFSSSPSAAARGIDRVVHIAYRTDGRAGTGTAEDPFDGSTTNKFDTVFRRAVGDATYTGGSVQVIIGPGTFTWSGSRSNDNSFGLFKAGNSYVIRGQGAGITTLKIADGRLASGGRTKAYQFYNDGTGGNIEYLEISHLTLDCNGANQTLVSSLGEAELGAVQVYAKEGYLHDVDITGIYAHPPEYFPVNFSQRSNPTLVNGVFTFERCRAWPIAGPGDNDNMLVFSANDPAWGGMQGTLTATIRDCAVYGTGTEIAFGASSFSQATFQNNYATNCFMGINTEVYTNRNFTALFNRFSYVDAGIRFRGASGSQNGVVAFNRFENPPGGGVVFTGDDVTTLAWGNFIDAGYALNVTEHQLLRGYASTNQFQLQGGTNLVLRSGVKLTNQVINAGSVAAPSISIEGDSNTGIASQGADNISLVTGGAERIGANTSWITLGLPIYVPDGSAGVPSVTTGSDSTTGFYRAGAGAWSFSSAGTSRVTFSSGGIAVQPLTQDRLIYAGVGNILTSVTLGSGLSFSGGTLSASGGAITNSAAQVVGAGADYNLTMSYARLDFGTTDVELTLPEAGTYLLLALVEFTEDNLGAGFGPYAKFYNSTDTADVAGSEVRGGTEIAGSSSAIEQLTLQSVVTVAGPKTIQIYVKNGHDASGQCIAARSSMRYVKLY